MKKRLVMMFLALGMSFSLMLGGCGSAADDDREQIEEEDEDEDEDDEENDDDDHETPETPEARPAQTIDYSDEEAIADFVYGSWTIMDKYSGTEYGTLDIGKNGKVRFTLSTGESTEGSIVFTDTYNSGDLKGNHGYELTLNDLESTFDSWIDTDTSRGLFKIAQAPGRDYLFLEEIGNGGSTIGYDVFTYPGDEPYSGHFSLQWIFVRDNDVEEEAEPSVGDTFYAFALENGDDGLLLQRLDAITYETSSEYTGYRYMEAVFDESAYSEAAWYEFSKDADTSEVYETDRLSAQFPVDIYEVTTDGDGAILKMSEAERSAYGAYELYPLEQEWSFTDTSFTVNGFEEELETYAKSGISITDCYEYGDYLIIEAFVSPRENDYIFYNMRTAWKDREIFGNNLLLGDSLADSYYTDLSEIFDLFGETVYQVDGDEIYDLAFEAGGKKLKISYWTDNYNNEKEEIIQKPECLNAPIMAFSNFRHDVSPKTWREFMEYAPDDALFMVMVNPFYDDAWDFFQPEFIDDGSDIVYVVALADDLQFSFGDGTYITLPKGGIHAYSLTVPEGGPSLYLTATASDGREATWPVAIISGKDDIRWKFI
jgi:hypothetical protein